MKFYEIVSSQKILQLAFILFFNYVDTLFIVVTLALGSRPRQGLVKVQAKKEARKSHFILPGL